MNCTSRATFFLFLAVALVLPAQAALEPAAPASDATFVATTFVVTNVDFQNFLINGLPDPDLTLVRGETYQFDLQGVPAFHPFFIKTIQSVGSANTYDDGVSGNGASGESDIMFAVPENAPDQLFYNCGNHAAMTGNISIIDGALVFADGFE